MSKRLPHEGVNVRLGVSPIHGVGVFAQQPIQAGSNVFANDSRDIRWVPATVLAERSLSDFQRSYYNDFAIRRGKELGCPANFNLLTVGWYVNEPRKGEQPNLVADAQYNLLAARDIAEGEELTLLYASLGGPQRD